MHCEAPTMGSKDRYALLKERALANFELLINYWKLDYTKIGDKEYDFLSPTREDTNFGACRFNVVKGYGKDFAGINFSKADFEAVGSGFSKEDFAGFTNYGEARTGFDIIGLCQRVHNRNSYQEAAEQLKQDLIKLSNNTQILEVTQEDIEKRYKEIEIRKGKILEWATKAWKYSQPFRSTLAEKYLESREIFIPLWCDEPSIKFHPRVYNKEIEKTAPCVLFKVSNSPASELKAIHRIWIALDGSRKARLNNPKMALGPIEGGAIWFGTPHEKLYIAEGPEEALNIKYNFDCKFVCSTVYSTNYHNLIIPNYVKEVVLCPDDCDSGAGKEAAMRAIKEYTKQNKKIKMKMHNKY